MARLAVTHAARADIRKIVDYLETNAGKAVALRFALAFDAAFDRVADLPGVGSPRREFGPNIRLSIVDPTSSSMTTTRLAIRSWFFGSSTDTGTSRPTCFGVHSPDWWPPV